MAARRSGGGFTGTVLAVIAGTVALVILFLVLSNADAFAGVTGNIGSVYSNGVQTLQGR